MRKRVLTTDTSSRISRLDHKIRLSDDRLLRASVRRSVNAPYEKRLHGTNPIVARFLKYFDADGASSYRMLPEERSKQQKFRWLVELEGLPGVNGSLRIAIAGDVTLGVQRDPTAKPDLDLGAYGAGPKGVSRQHVLIRPTQQRLYLIDLASSNGTFLNTVRVGPSQAKELHDQDLISLGALSFRVRIKAKPIK